MMGVCEMTQWELAFWVEESVKDSKRQSTDRVVLTRKGRMAAKPARARSGRAGSPSPVR